MALTAVPSASDVPDDVDVRFVADQCAVVDYGRVVALANDDPGERERAPLLFHDETIVAPTSLRSWPTSAPSRLLAR